MSPDSLTVETTVSAPVGAAWDADTSPDRIRPWNFAADEWHCPSASVDLCEGGAFSWRMEAGDGSMGFDFARTDLTIQPNRRFVYEFGGRQAIVEFVPQGVRTWVRVAFDPETQNPPAMQSAGWQAILDNDAAHVEASER